MKRISLIGLALLLLLSGCAPDLSRDDEGVQQTKEEEEKAVIPKYKISDEYYRTILPFEGSSARGLTISRLNTRYDVDEMELGLMRIAQDDFNTDDFYFKEGQYLSTSTVRKWLNRKFTKEQYKEIMKNNDKLKESDNIGLNPIDPGTGDLKKRNEENPIYLSHILEHNYMVQTGDNKVGLGGIVIGLALNPVHYYQSEDGMASYEYKIPHKEMVSKGKEMAQEILTRLRNKEDLKEVPITIALYEQAEKSSVVPGNFIASAHVGEGKNKISDWKDINEKYYLFPSEGTQEKYLDDYKSFLNFKQDIEAYFPNYSGVVGRGYYRDDQLQEMKMEIPIQFYGKSEAVGFTQYVYGKILDHFPEYIAIEVSVTSVDGLEALVVKEAGSNEPTVHITH